MATRCFYGVEILTETGPYLSRYFQTLRAARLYARRCEKTWVTRLLRYTSPVNPPEEL